MKKYTIHLNDKHCKACGICIGLCPKKVFTTNYGSIIFGVGG